MYADFFYQILPSITCLQWKFNPGNIDLLLNYRCWIFKMQNLVKKNQHTSIRSSRAFIYLSKSNINCFNKEQLWTRWLSKCRAASWLILPANCLFYFCYVKCSVQFSAYSQSSMSLYRDHPRHWSQSLTRQQSQNNLIQLKTHLPHRANFC